VKEVAFHRQCLLHNNKSKQANLYLVTMVNIKTPNCR
jgi:hypothetical protein